MTAAPVRAGALAVVTAGLFVTLMSPMNRAVAAPGSHPPMLVVLFTPPTPDPLVARIEAELAAVHIAVRILDVPSDSEIDAVVTGEISSGASAAIRVLPRSSGTEVWTKDTTAQVLRRRSISGADTSDAATSVVAWRTVEFLRASLLDIGRRPVAGSPAVKNGTDQASVREATVTATAPPATAAATATATAEKVVPTASQTAVVLPADTVQPTSATATRTPTPTPTRFAIAAGPAFVASFGGIAPIASGVVTGHARIAGRTGVEVMAMFPIIPSRLTYSEGSVQIGASLFGAAVEFRLTPPGAWVADCAVGGSALRFRTVGTGVGSVGSDPSQPNQGVTDSTWRFAAHVRFGAGVDITPWLTLRGDVIAGASPRIVVTYFNPHQNVSSDLAAWGPTFAVATVGLQANW